MIRPLLVVRAQLGDMRALNELLQLLQEPLYAHIVGILGTETGADDVLQDVLLIIAKKIGNVREPAWARAWAYRIANREAVREARRRRHSVEVEIEEEMLVTAETDLDEAPVDVKKLFEAVDKLPPHSRTVVRLHYQDGLTLVEIAEALEVPVGTVKSRLAYALNLLRRNHSFG